MSYAIVHMQKFNASGLRGIQSHIRRDRISRTNPDIDYDKSSENYSLMPKSKEISLKDFVNLIIKEKTDTSKKIRKDAVLVNSFVITSDKEFFDNLPIEKQRQFFYDSANFFQERYGNLVYADVHLDETTPHMHLGLVPIKDGRLSSKAIFGNKVELQNLQTDFANEVGKKYGLERGKENSGATHLSELRFKEKSLEKDIEHLEQEKETLKTQIKALCDMVKDLPQLVELLRKKSYYNDLPRIDLMDFEEPKPTWQPSRSKEEDFDIEF